MPQGHLASRLGVDRGDGAGERRGQGQLHLHRLKDTEHVALGDLLARLDADVEDGAGHRRDQRAVADLGAVVGERVGALPGPALPAVGDLDVAGAHVEHGVLGVAVDDQVHRVVGERDGADPVVVDQAAVPVDHETGAVERHRVGRRVGAQPPPVGVPGAGGPRGRGAARRRVGLPGVEQHLGPGREDAGQVAVGGGHLVPVEPGGIDAGVAELLPRRQRPQEAGVGGQPEHGGVVEGRDQAGAGRLAVDAPHDDLAEHRVVGGGDLLARDECVVDAHPGALALDARRPAHQRGGAGLGQEPAEGVLGVDPRLDRVALEGDVVLGEAERLTGGDLQLQRDQVDPLAAHPRHLLGDRVLDLEPGVHLEEVELARVVVEEELDGARTGVADLRGQRDGRGGDRGPLLLADRGGRGLLQHLLVPALGRAVALEEVHHVAVGVAHDLHLDVAARLDVLLDEHGVVAERRARLALRGAQRLGVLGRRADHPHALAATAGRGLDQHRVGEGGRVVGQVVRRHHGHARGDGDVARGVLAAHRVHHLGGRADQGDAGLGQGAGERRPLGEEAVAGVHEAGAALARGGDHLLDVEVGADPHRDVGLGDVQRAGVEVGVQGHGAPPEAARGGQDPAGDLAAVGDQERVHGGPHILKMP